jgi:exosortase/archaeosortase
LVERRSPGWSPPAGAVPRFASTFLALQTLTVCFPETAFAPLNRHTAWMAARLLTLCGLPPVLQGNLLGRGSFTVEVVTECSAFYMGILFLSFVVAVPANPAERGRRSPSARITVILPAANIPLMSPW